MVTSNSRGAPCKLGRYVKCAWLIAETEAQSQKFCSSLPEWWPSGPEPMSPDSRSQAVSATTVTKEYAQNKSRWWPLPDRGSESPQGQAGTSATGQRHDLSAPAQLAWHLPLEIRTRTKPVRLSAGHEHSQSSLPGLYLWFLTFISPPGCISPGPWSLT